MRLVDSFSLFIGWSSQLFCRHGSISNGGIARAVLSWFHVNSLVYLLRISSLEGRELGRQNVGMRRLSQRIPLFSWRSPAWLSFVPSGLDLLHVGEPCSLNSCAGLFSINFFAVTNFPFMNPFTKLPSHSTNLTILTHPFPSCDSKCGHIHGSVVIARNFPDGSGLARHSLWHPWHGWLGSDILHTIFKTVKINIWPDMRSWLPCSYRETSMHHMRAWSTSGQLKGLLTDP